jgi:FkbM family methyltransferase
MKKLLTTMIERIIPNNIKFKITLPYRQELAKVDNYFSQNGEDVVLQRFFHNKKDGFFVDVGAHHPVRFSNTMKLYLHGWRGINIDALPGSMKAFNEIRPEDINLEIGISQGNSALEYFSFNEPALNTFDPEVAKSKHGKNGYLIEKTIIIQTVPLSELLDKHIPGNTAIDYMNIDVEGLDMQVLQSNNWAKYKPLIISIESNNNSSTLAENETYVFLKSKGYSLSSIMYNTLLFTRNDLSSNSPIRL